MNILVVGLSHKTAPVAVRERVAFAPTAMERPLHELLALPAVEIVPDNAFFDFEAKYTKGKTQYETPARLTAAEAEAAAALALAAYRALGCRGLGRVDIIVRPGKFLGFPTHLRVSVGDKAGNEAFVRELEIILGSR